MSNGINASPADWASHLSTDGTASSLLSRLESSNDPAGGRERYLVLIASGMVSRRVRALSLRMDYHSGREMRDAVGFRESTDRQICTIEQGQAKEKLVQAQFGHSSRTSSLPVLQRSTSHAKRDEDSARGQSRRLAMPLASAVTPRTASRNTAQNIKFWNQVLELIFEGAYTHLRLADETLWSRSFNGLRIIRLNWWWQSRFGAFFVP